MVNSSQNNLFKETLLASSETNLNLVSSLLKTVPTTEINNIVVGEKKPDNIQEIYDRYNILKKKIHLLLNNIE
jgi:hypothetical protein